MKKLFIITLACATLSLSACGQKLNESQVPDAARMAFQKKYPHTKANWEKEKGRYEVNFKNKGKSMSLLMDGNGTINETETDIAVNSLPSPAQLYVKEHYKGAKIKEAAQIVPYSGELIYEAEVNGKDLLFDRKGAFISEAKK